MFGKASGQEQKQLHMACAFVCAFVFALLCVYMIRGGETCEEVRWTSPGGEGVGLSSRLEETLSAPYLQSQLSHCA